MNRTAPRILSLVSALALLAGTLTGLTTPAAQAAAQTTHPAAAPSPAAGHTPLNPALIRAVEEDTGIDLSYTPNGTLTPRLFPALDFSHINRLKLADRNRTDHTGRKIPWGANNWHCTPSWRHPLPVVLVHGFNTTMSANWLAISPLLVAAGYCVYALNWGVVPHMGNAGQAPLRTGATQLHDFINRVLTTTGAPQVDIVGHSAGGVMPRWYLNKLGGHQHVRNFFALTPANNGTDIFGLTTTMPGLTQKIVDQKSVQQPAILDLLPDSQFIHDVNTPQPTMPDVWYTVIATIYDEMVTPVPRQFLPAAPNVRNYLLQAMCPLSYASHGSMAEHPVVFQLLENVLGDNHYPIRCV